MLGSAKACDCFQCAERERERARESLPDRAIKTVRESEREGESGAYPDRKQSGNGRYGGLAQPARRPPLEALGGSPVVFMDELDKTTPYTRPPEPAGAWSSEDGGMTAQNDDQAPNDNQRRHFFL